MKVILLQLFTIFLIITILDACGHKPQQQPDVLLRIGDKEVTKEEIIMQIPQGILPSDSIRLFGSLVDGWIKDNLLADFAADRLMDTTAIERKVKDYRNKLVVQEYLMGMRESQNFKTKQEDIRNYYEAHKQEIVNETPLVKGVFVKIASDIADKERIRQLLTSRGDNAIDNFERDWMEKALEYEYFKDRWVDWNTVTSFIPFRFGNPDEVLAQNNFFTTDYDDCSYFLAISEYMPSGSTQPFEYASFWIDELLQQGEMERYETALVNELVKKAIDEKKLEIIGYDPMLHKMIVPENK